MPHQSDKFSDQKPVAENTSATPTSRSKTSLEEVRRILRGNQPLDEYIAMMKKLPKCPSLAELRAMKARGEL